MKFSGDVNIQGSIFIDGLEAKDKAEAKKLIRAAVESIDLDFFDLECSTSYTPMEVESFDIMEVESFDIEEDDE